MIGFYFDEHMNRVVADVLRQRGYDVEMEVKPDEVHLAYATQHDLVMVTFDHPFAGEHK